MKKSALNQPRVEINRNNEISSRYKSINDWEENRPLESVQLNQLYISQKMCGLKRLDKLPPQKCFSCPVAFAWICSGLSDSGRVSQKSCRAGLSRFLNVFYWIESSKTQTQFTQALHNRNQSLSDKRFSIRVEISLQTEKRNS